MNSQKRRVYETLKKFFGEEWLNREIGKVRLDGYHNMNPMNLARLDIHPIVKAIIDTQIKLDKFKNTAGNSVPIGRAEMVQELMHENLTILEDKLDLPDIQRRLRDKNEFPKVEYEIAIAAGYRRMGYEVEFIPRQASSRTGEFFVTDSDGVRVLIECKKKDMTLQAQQKINSWWEEFQHLTMDALKKAKKYYGVAVFTPPNPEKADTHKIKEEILKAVSLNSEGEFSFLEGRYRVVLKKFCEAGQSIPAETFNSFSKAYDHDHGVCSL